MRYFITGGSGFIGSNLSKSLLENHNEVVVYDDFSRGNSRKIDSIKNDIEIVNGDIRDLDKLVKYSKKADVFIHLAAINGTKFFYEKPQEVLDVSLRGILSVIDACKLNNIVEVIFSSSSEVYQQPREIPTPEDVELIIPDVFNPRYSYGAGKIISEIVLLNYFKDFFKKVMIFRPHNVYGPDMGNEHVIPELIKKVNLTQNKKLKIKGNGEQTRAFIYIDDFIEALNLIILNGSHREIYHIGNKDEISIKHLTEKIICLSNNQITIETSDAPRGETKRRCPNNEKILKLGYRQKINIDEGLKKVFSWYTNQDPK